MKWQYRPDVEAEVEEIATTYEAARAGLGDEFLDELEGFYTYIGSHPELYYEVLPGVRRGMLRRFPYHVYYTLLSEDTIEVIAVVHHAQHECVWKDRA